MSRPLTEQELHNLAMNYVGKELEKRCFEFVAVNSKLKKHPQFVCIDKKSQYYFVIVKMVILPENPNNYDVLRKQVYSREYTNSNGILELNLSNLQNGIYLMELHNANGIVKKRLILE